MEQYLYGRSKEFHEGKVLGGEYPCFEYSFGDGYVHNKFETAEGTEKEILQSTFNVIWDSYSISLDEYQLTDEKAVFGRNLANLKSELAPAASHGSIDASTPPVS